ncbi:MAG: hypothetical protein ACRDTH_14890 [Pseudonocardiaceae bacterium]
MKNFNRSVDNSRKDMSEFRTAFSGFGDFVKKSVMSVTNLPLATEAIASVKSLVGVIGLVPAVAGAAGLAVGTLKVAFSGFGEAMKNIRDPKKFAEAIKDMPPPMQETAKAVQALLPQWDSLKKSVQSTMFKGLAEQVKGLGLTYLPILNTATTATAGSFNRAAIGISQFLRDPGTMSDISVSMGNMSKFTDGFARALKPAVQIFVDFVKVGSEFLPAMGDGMAKAAEKAAAFVGEARQTGKLKAWIQEGIDTLKAFVAMIVNVGQILNGVLSAANVNGQGFAQTLERITARIEAWVKSAEGQQKIREVFDGLRNVAFALLAILGPLSTVIFAIAGAFAKLSPEMQQAVGMMIGWGGLVALLTVKVRTLVMGIINLTGDLIKFGAGVAGVFPKLLQLGRTLLYAGINATYAAARFALAAASTILSLARMAVVGILHATRLAVTTVAQFAWMTATAIYHAGVMYARTVAYAAVNAAHWIAHMIRIAAVTVAQWAWMAAQAMAKAAVLAASWFVAMGPIGWVIAAVVGLAALIIANWDTVKRWTQQAWTAVSGAVTAAWDWIKRATGDAVGWVLGKLGEFVGWLAGLPGRIMGALGNLGGLLVGLGHDLVMGLWRGISGGWDWLRSQVANLARSLYNAAKSALGIGSPSKLFRDEIGRWIPKGLALGITGNLGEVRGAAAALTDATAMGAIPTPRGVRAGAGAGVPVLEIRSGGSRLDELLVEVLRKAIRAQGGDPGVIGG